jgi:PAS domain S-box-containing protein
MSQRELERLQAVHRFLNLKIDKDHDLQEIVELAAELCETPIAFIYLINQQTQYFKYDADEKARQAVLKDSFCPQIPDTGEIMLIENAAEDERFANNPLVIGEPGIRFYAGSLLKTHDGHTLGSVCLMDTQARQLSIAQKHLLKILGKRVVQIMEFEFSINILKKQFLEAKDAEIKLRSFFDSGGAFHLLIDRSLNIIAFNKNMAAFIKRIYNVDLHDGIAASQVLSGPAFEQFAKECKLALNGGHVEYEREVNYQGELIWWLVTMEPCYGPEGEIIAISYNAYDITERKLHEQQIIAQNNSLKQIAHIQSHELRKPVASILVFMELFRTNGYQVTTEELMMMELAAKELDEKIKNIVKFTD